MSATRALVMGLGRFGGGVGAARFLARRGMHVLVTDQAAPETLEASVAALAGLEVELALGGHRPDDFAAAELVVANPAVAPDHPLLALARARGARVTSEIELFLEASPATAVCVTGTQGKSSTCNLTASLLAASGRSVLLGGNIGGSLLDRLDELRPSDTVVLELSSYQLEALARPPALPPTVRAVAITNVLADHLERHGSLAAYAAAKARLLEIAAPGATAILPAGDERLWDAPGAPGLRRVPHHDPGRLGPGRTPGTVAGACFDEERFWLDGEPLARVRDLRLPGGFQRANAAVALALARSLGAPAEALAAALPEVRGLSHRLEDLGQVRGRRVWDNAVSTTPDSTIAALACVGSGATLLVGGKRKALDYAPLVRDARERGARAVVFGAAAESLADELRAGGVEAWPVPALEEAVARALELTPQGGELLFSPACSSFDAFPNFQARALAFRAHLAAAGR